ncbi:uncharacterized protein EI97DRAFT_482832 [Westerdykella ornata]|uniref:Uncharacterized protein n=1 Tax=Westerdykella ornata TaxID=318751 RepID=A0A6A6J9Y2_WESOR|nr:uncharacterized protein EI97DRAFT_482832 [Westerdykella ornata]KAF2273145.1 hypothetical protein EI97DRAFT_482832 [Westerdykella ornata]
MRQARLEPGGRTRNGRHETARAAAIARSRDVVEAATDGQSGEESRERWQKGVLLENGRDARVAGSWGASWLGFGLAENGKLAVLGLALAPLELCWRRRKGEEKGCRCRAERDKQSGTGSQQRDWKSKRRRVNWRGSQGREAITDARKRRRTGRRRGCGEGRRRRSPENVPAQVVP